jgi:hypothetical protein
VGEPEGKRPLGRLRSRWVDKIKIGWYELDRSGSVWGPTERSCENGNETSGSIKRCEVLSCTIGGFSRRAQLHKISINCHCNVGTFERSKN